MAENDVLERLRVRIMPAQAPLIYSHHLPIAILEPVDAFPARTFRPFAQHYLFLCNGLLSTVRAIWKDQLEAGPLASIVAFF